MLNVACLPETCLEVINLGSSAETQIIELAKIILKLTRSDSEIEFHLSPADDPKRRCPDTRKLEKLARWKTQVTFEEEVKRTIKSFQQKKT